MLYLIINKLLMIKLFIEYRLIHFLTRELKNVKRKFVISFVKKGFLSNITEYDSQLYDLLLIKEKSLNPSKRYYRVWISIIKKCKETILDFCPDLER